MCIPYEFVRYYLGKWEGGGRGGPYFKILKAFLFYYCLHSANINQKLYFFFLFWGGLGSFGLQMYFFYCPSVTMPGFGSLA